MRITFDQFKGALANVSPMLLPPGYAQTAVNYRSDSGRIEPFGAALEIQSIAKPGDIRSILKLDDTWIYWTGVIEAIKAQLANSDWRIFYTGDGYPKQTDHTLGLSGLASTYPTEARRFGVVKPDAGQPLVVEPQGVGDGTIGDVFSYVYTRVTTWGEESAPSPATAVATLEGDQHVRLNNFRYGSIATTGNDIAYFRLYRLNSSASGSEYQLVRARPGNLSATAVYDIPVADVPDSLTYVYDANDGVTPDSLSDDLGAVIQSETWEAPPDDLHALVQCQGSFLAGLSANQICFSEPAYGYAWPVEYRLTLSHDGVGLGVLDGAVLALTTAYPTLAIGSDPASMQKKTLAYNQACVSKQGIVSTEAGVIYPSPDGLCLCDGMAVMVVTRKETYSRSQWKALNPENLVGFYHDGKYYGFFKGTATGIVFDFKGGKDVVSIDLGARLVYGGFVVPEEDALYLLVREGSTYYIDQWEGGASKLTAVYRSGRVQLPAAMNMGAARAVGDHNASAPAGIRLYAGGRRRKDHRVTDQKPFNLPSGYRADTVEIEYEGTGVLDRVQVAPTVQELIHG